MLEVRGASKTFNAGTANEVRPLQGIDLAIEPGSFVVIIGTNGSGKSTLLNAIAGTFPLDSGSISVDGLDVTKWPESRRAQLIGRVFQNPFSGTAPNLEIAENLALSALRGRRRGLDWLLSARAKSAMREQVRQLDMALEDRLADPIGSLSGGQRQALTLLMATWVKPKLVLLDEHTAALDPKSAEKVMSLSANIISREKLTAIMVTHSMQQAASFGDQVVMLHRGRIIHHFAGAERRRLRSADLLARFEDVRRADLLDESAARLLERTYV
jgi:putative ABC transport system ATP-binding protein